MQPNPHKQSVAHPRLSRQPISGRRYHPTHPVLSLSFLIVHTTTVKSATCTLRSRTSNKRIAQYLHACVSREAFDFSSMERYVNLHPLSGSQYQKQTGLLFVIVLQKISTRSIRNSLSHSGLFNDFALPSLRYLLVNMVASPSIGDRDRICAARPRRRVDRQLGCRRSLRSVSPLFPFLAVAVD